MISNLERYKKDLEALIKKGEMLGYAMQAQFNGDDFKTRLRKQVDEEKIKAFSGSLYAKKLSERKLQGASWLSSENTN